LFGKAKNNLVILNVFLGSTQNSVPITSTARCTSPELMTGKPNAEHRMLVPAKKMVAAMLHRQYIYKSDIRVR
jgi:hypothetical protein